MRQIVLIGPMFLLLAACAGTPKPAEPASTAFADRCTQLYAPMTRPHASAPNTMADIETLARRLHDERSPLHPILAAAGPDAKLALDTHSERGQPFQSARMQAVETLQDRECGDAFHEFVAPALFIAPSPSADSPLLPGYHAAGYDDPKYWRIYLTLLLMQTSAEPAP